MFFESLVETIRVKLYHYNYLPDGPLVYNCGCPASKPTNIILIPSGLRSICIHHEVMHN